MKKILTIAGSDCSGGAGIQADLKTIAAHRMYGMSVITALTAQNTTGVYGIHTIDPAFVGQQLDCVFADIRPDAVKIGMVANREILAVIADKLRHYQAVNIVCDPVMAATSGSLLLQPDSLQAYISQLMAIARLITPNIPEAEALTGLKISSRDDMVRAAQQLASLLPASVLVKGGHLTDDAKLSDDVLIHDGQTVWFSDRRVKSANTHGTGCTLSSAIACQLANGCSLSESISRAKSYVTGALADGLDLGQGSGPLNHVYQLKERYSDETER